MEHDCYWLHAFFTLKTKFTMSYTTIDQFQIIQIQFIRSIYLCIRCGDDEKNDLSIDFSTISLKTRVKERDSDDQKTCFKFEDKVVTLLI